ncbi:MAG: hypothetical protein ACRDV4_00065 [Acidimicrobiales bacterium]
METDWAISAAADEATALPMAAPTRVPFTPKMDATAAAATAARAEAVISTGFSFMGTLSRGRI